MGLLVPLKRSMGRFRKIHAATLTTQKAGLILHPHSRSLPSRFSFTASSIKCHGNCPFIISDPASFFLPTAGWPSLIQEDWLWDVNKFIPKFQGLLPSRWRQEVCPGSEDDPDSVRPLTWLVMCISASVGWGSSAQFQTQSISFTCSSLRILLHEVVMFVLWDLMKMDGIVVSSSQNLTSPFSV